MGGAVKPNPRILMCPPEYYGIEYEINPWMRKEDNSDRERSRQQWSGLVTLLTNLGAQVEQMTPVVGLPDMVFTANAGVVFRDLFVTSRFRHAERQGESEHFERWFAEHGYRVVSLPSASAFEGAGDALFCGETLFTGYIYRSEIKAHHELGRLLEREVLSLELVNPRYYHLDTCFCPLAPGVALYYPPAFDEYGQKVLAENIANLIPVEEEDAFRFGCNAVVVGTNVVINAGSPRLAEQLAKNGFQPIQTELTEYIKSGGSAKCLTLRLDGEEAATW